MRAPLASPPMAVNDKALVPSSVTPVTEFALTAVLGPSTAVPVVALTAVFTLPA